MGLEDMGDIKWISIATDIFDDEKMCAIESLPDGIDIEIVWLKILCLAGKCNENGFLMISKEIPYTDQMLATSFRMDIATIQRAIDVLQSMRMIETFNNVYMVSNWMKYQSNTQLQHIKEINRIRQQRFRDNQKAIMQKNICTYCGDTATGYDHVVALSRGGTDTAENKVFCCKQCNSIKNDKPLLDFLNWNRDRIKDELVLNNPVLNKMVELHEGKYRNVTVTQQNNVTCHDFCSICNMSYVDVYKEIINYLNNKIGTNYKYTSKKTQTLIHARTEEGFTIEDFKTVIDKKAAEWLGTDMAQYLRPETLFGTKFEGYLNQKEKETRKTDWSKIQ